MSGERESAWLRVLAEGPLDPAAARTLITAARAAGATQVRRTLAARTDLDPATAQLLADDDDVWTALTAADRAAAGHGELVALLAARADGATVPGRFSSLPIRAQLALVELLTPGPLAEVPTQTSAPTFVRMRALWRLVTEFGREELIWPSDVPVEVLAPLLPATAQLRVAEMRGSGTALRCWARPLLARVRAGETEAMGEITEGLWGFSALTSDFAGWIAPQLASRDVAVDPSVARLLVRAMPDPAPELVAGWAAARGSDPVVLAELAAGQVTAAGRVFAAGQITGFGYDGALLEELAANPVTPTSAVLAVLRAPVRPAAVPALAMVVHGADERVRRAALAAAPMLLAAAPPADGDRPGLARELLADRRALPGERFADDDLMLVMIGNLRGDDLLELSAADVQGLLAQNEAPGVLQSAVRAALLARFAADPGALLALARLPEPPPDMSVTQLLDLAATVTAPAGS